MSRLLPTCIARIAVCCLLLPVGVRSRAQVPPPVQSSVSSQPPFWNEIAEFKHKDSLQHPPSNAILFIGSSSFRKWTSVQADFPGYTIINRGFGGSTFDDLIRYAKDIIYPYHPKQVVIYCGDNDLAGDRKMTGKKVYRRFVKLYDMIRKHLGDVDIVFVSIKPSPSREKLMPEMEEANDLIRNFIAQRSHAAFVDVYHLMLNARGRPMDELFIADKLHMNEKGYKIWQQALLPYLDK
ncbi:MAG TPA: GDSL-type esterase/lipase family protein [Puia sp.]|nr:GDSL-type esterase/lipase family protein [Puia sp.]